MQERMRQERTQRARGTGDPAPIGRFRLLRRLHGLDRELAMRLAAQQIVLRHWQTCDLTSRSGADLAAAIGHLSRQCARLDEIGTLAVRAGARWERLLIAALQPAFGAEARSVLARLLAGTDLLVGVAHAYAIFDLAEAARRDPAALIWLRASAAAPGDSIAPHDWRDLPAESAFRAALASFLDRYGHRAAGEADLRCPRWAEDPSGILDQVRHALAYPTARQPRDAARRLRAETERAVRRHAGWRAPIALWLARRLAAATACRDAVRSAQVAPLLPLRRLLHEAAGRMLRAGQIDALHQMWQWPPADVALWLAASGTDRKGRGVLADAAAATATATASAAATATAAAAAASTARIAVTRHASGNAEMNAETNAEIDTERTAATCAPARANVRRTSRTEWTGIAVSPGLVRGAARIVRHPRDAVRLRLGEVLVCASSDPGWTPLFLRASAIVIASGDYWSHGAIAARELARPAVVDLPGIVDTLRDGDVLVVDGASGHVTCAERAADGASAAPDRPQPQLQPRQMPVRQADGASVLA